MIYLLYLSKHFFQYFLNIFRLLISIAAISLTFTFAGLVVNIYGIIFLLYKKKTRYVFQKLMIFNALWDISILVLMIVGFSLPLRCQSDTKEIVSRNLFRFGVPIMHISLTGIVTRFLHIIQHTYTI